MEKRLRRLDSARPSIVSMPGNTACCVAAGFRVSRACDSGGDLERASLASARLRGALRPCGAGAIVLWGSAEVAGQGRRLAWRLGFTRSLIPDHETLAGRRDLLPLAERFAPCARQRQRSRSRVPQACTRVVLARASASSSPPNTSIPAEHARTAARAILPPFAACRAPPLLDVFVWSRQGLPTTPSFRRARMPAARTTREFDRAERCAECAPNGASAAAKCHFWPKRRSRLFLPYSERSRLQNVRQIRRKSRSGRGGPAKSCLTVGAWFRPPTARGPVRTR